MVGFGPRTARSIEEIQHMNNRTKKKGVLTKSPLDSNRPSSTEEHHHQQNFLRKNWFNIVSSLLSIVAIFLALKNLQYTQTATSVVIKVDDVREVYGTGELNTWILNIGTCSNQDSSQYIISFATHELFWISNTGGLQSTLLDANFTSDVNIQPGINTISPNWTSSMYQYDDPYTIGQPIFLLNIPSGSTMPVYVNGSNDIVFSSLDAALRYTTALSAGASDNIIKKYGVWTLKFGNGMTYNKIYDTAIMPGKIQSWQNAFKQPCQ